MSSIFRTFITVFVLFLAHSTPSDAESEKWRRYEETLIKISTDPEYTKLWPEHIKQFTNYEAIAFKKQKRNSFPCSTYSSPEVPSSVHQLQPGDIKVIGAMGDSITAGNGINALTPIGALTEYRGHSWSIGGVNTYEEVLTLPNILKKYNPDLTGYATGTGKRDSSISKLNVAYPGNTAENMPLQAAMLVDRIKSMPGVDFENDWKMVTLFIGGNDLCDYCYDVDRYTIEKYQNHVKGALDILHATLPRTFVNLVSIFDLTPLATVADNVICRAIHWAVCDCPKNAEPGLIKGIAMQYSQAVSDLIASKRYDTKDDFTVVFQPFMRDNDVPRQENGNPDMSFFCPDCFHFSGVGHEAVATMLWNAMFEPVGSKKTLSSFKLDLYCPAEGEYFQTAANSKISEVEAHHVQNAPAALVAEETPNTSSPHGNLPLILGVTCSVGFLAAVALVGLIVYRKRRTPMEDLTVLTS